MRDGRSSPLFDAGLQLERTHLAWSRTGLGFVINALLVARLARRITPAVAGYALAVAIALIGIVVMMHGRRTYAPRAAALMRGHSTVQPRGLQTLALSSAIMSLAAAVLAVVALLEE